MTNPHPQREAKKLRKSAKRRRQYAENLDRTVAEIMAMAPTAKEIAFAEDLKILADSELKQAKMEEAQAKELKVELSQYAGTVFSSREQEERSRAAMEALDGKLAVDRVNYMMLHLAMELTFGSPGEKLDKIEQASNIHWETKPQVGARIRHAEVQLFGNPRF